MKYRIFTYAGDALPIAYKLQQEGCEVVVGMVHDKATVHSSKEGEIRLENAEAKRRRLALFDGLVEMRPADLLIKGMRAISTLKSTLYFSIEIICFNLAIKSLRCRSTAIFRLKRITYSNGTAIRQSNLYVSIILGCMCLT